MVSVSIMQKLNLLVVATTGPVVPSVLIERSSYRAKSPMCQWLCAGWKANVPMVADETRMREVPPFEAPCV